MADGYLNFDTTVNTDGFQKGISGISNSLGGLKNVLGKLAVAAAAAFSVKAIADFGKAAVGLASDLQEAQNVVDTAFGETSGKMEAFAANSIKQFGISQLAAKQTGSSFMAMASGMGIAQESASDMAIALTGLSADMASFYNVEQEVAQTALASVFTGETETLKRFGIVMTEANLEAYALSQGITKSVQAMSQAEKVQLRYNYVMSQTTLAQGDFARTSDGWANQTRILSEQWKELQTTIGNAIMNVVLPCIQTLNSALSSIIGYAKAAYNALAEFFDWETASSGVAAGITNDIAASVTEQNALTDAVEKTAKAQENQLAGFDKINKLSDTSGTDSTAVTPITGAVGGGGTASVTFDADPSPAQKKTEKFLRDAKKTFGNLKKYFKSKFGDIFSGIFGGLSAEFSELKQTFGNVWANLKTLADPLKTYFTSDFIPYLQTAFTVIGNIATGLFDTFNRVFSDIWSLVVFPLIQKFVTVGLPMITQFATQSWQTLGVAFDAVKIIFDTLWDGCISPISDAIARRWCDVIDILAEFWNNWGVPIFDGIREALNTMKETFLNVWNSFLKPVFDNFMNVTDDLWNNHIKPLFSELMDCIGELITGATSIYNKFIAPIVNWFVKVLGPPISKVINTIVKSIGNAVGNIIDRARAVIQMLKGVIQYVTGVFTGDWEKAWTGIKNFFGGIWDGFVSLVKTPVNLIIDIINGLTGAIESALNHIIDGINSISVDIPDAVADVVGIDSFGFDLSSVDIPEIPHLAQGTVIPANYGEFLAVLGDNETEAEVVSPLSTIEKAVENVLGRHGGVADISFQRWSFCGRIVMRTNRNE